MCDYSLVNLPNRLAAEGDVLMTYKFPSGSIGLASPDEVQVSRSLACRTTWSWGWLRRLGATTSAMPIVRAVCVPPGAFLRLYGIPEQVWRSAGVGAREEVTFTEITSLENRFRDAVRFLNGREVLLQKLGVGVGLTVERAH